MPAARDIRLTLVLVSLVAGLVWVWRTHVDALRVTVLVTATIGAATIIYVLLTYEILVQNQAMARAAMESTKLMERGLRFQYTPNLLFETIDTRNPILDPPAITPIDNDDHKRAVREFTSSREQKEKEQKEFVFAVVKNKGQGAATNLTIEVEYNITDKSSSNPESTVRKKTSVSMLDAGKAVALCIFIQRVPTAGDKVVLASARLTTSDFYRDAQQEPRQEINIDINNHYFLSEDGCVVCLK